MNKYLWTITSMSTLPKPPAPIEDCAVMARYTVKASNENNFTASIDGIVEFLISTTENLTPYTDLTEEQVLGWIQSEPNLVINTQANLDGQIASQITPPIVPEVTPLPWATK